MPARLAPNFFSASALEPSSPSNSNLLPPELSSHSHSHSPYPPEPSSLFGLETYQWEWSPRRLEVATACAEGLTITRVARRCGVSTQFVYYCLRHLPFCDYVADLAKEIRQHLFSQGVANRQQRIIRLNDTWEGLQEVIESRRQDALHLRATDPTNDRLLNAPGLHTGLVVTRTKVIGMGRNAQTVIESEVDRGLLSSLNDIEKQTAIELGQWQEKTELTHVQKAYVGVDLERV